MQNFEFRKSNHHRLSDRDVNDGNKDRKTLRCRIGILALTVLSHRDFHFRRGTACLRPRRSVHSHFKKNVMIPKCSLGSVDSIYVKKVYVWLK